MSCPPAGVQESVINGLSHYCSLSEAGGYRTEEEEIRTINLQASMMKKLMWVMLSLALVLACLGGLGVFTGDYEAYGLLQGKTCAS